ASRWPLSLLVTSAGLRDNRPFAMRLPSFGFGPRLPIVLPLWSGVWWLGCDPDFVSRKTASADMGAVDFLGRFRGERVAFRIRETFRVCQKVFKSRGAVGAQIHIAARVVAIAIVDRL